VFRNTERPEVVKPRRDSHPVGVGYNRGALVRKSVEYPQPVLNVWWVVQHHVAVSIHRIERLLCSERPSQGRRQKDRTEVRADAVVLSLRDVDEREAADRQAVELITRAFQK